MRRPLPFVILVALLLLALPYAARANDAEDAYNTPHRSADWGRPSGQDGPSGFGWNTPIPADAEVVPDNAEQVAVMRDRLGKPWEVPGHWWFNYKAVYTIDQTKLPQAQNRSVCLTYAVNGQFAGWADYMAEHEILVTSKVPIPPAASAPWGVTDLPYKDGGPDNGATIWYPDANTMWDLYQFRKAPAGTVDQKGRSCDFLADVASRMLMVGTHGVGWNPTAGRYPITYQWWQASPGYYRQNPPSEFRNVARAASKLPSAFGSITPEEWNNPSETDGFGHVVSIHLPWGRLHEFDWPAAATDNWSSWGYPAIKEGSRLRFAPTVDCNRWDGLIAGTSDPRRILFLRRIKGICVNGKRYGFVGIDQTGNGLGFLTLSSGGEWEKDAPDNVNGGHRWPNDYANSLYDLFTEPENFQVLKVPAEKRDWTAGCRC